MKTVKAVAPYIYRDASNFKFSPYESWVKLGGQTVQAHYPCRALHGLAYHKILPTIWKNKKEARIRFVSGYSIYFDTFPDYALYEVIPFFWDVWPGQVENVVSFISRHNVRTAFFTSSQTAERIQKLFPKMNVMYCPEGVNIDLYKKGAPLNEREVDVLEIGRKNANFFKTPLPENVKYVKTGNFSRVFKSDEDFRNALANTKVTISVPRCDVDKEIAGDIETLTQRYWECMLSGIVMVGRAPKELIDLIGYNPVIEWDGVDATPLVSDVLCHIEDFQSIVEKNYEAAQRFASWDIRIKDVMDYLIEKGYKV